MLIEMVHETEFKMLTSELDQEAIKQNEVLKSTYVDHKQEFEDATHALKATMAERKLELG